jgi:ABC-type multidrug transport system permease subunit
MKDFLYIVAIMSYLAAGFAFVTSFAVPNPDITWIMSGVFAICATVAAAGAAILSRLDSIVDKMND